MSPARALDLAGGGGVPAARLGNAVVIGGPNSAFASVTMRDPLG